MFRNREIIQFVHLFAAVTAVFTALGFVINPVAGILSLMSSAVFGLMFFIFTRARYKSIARISEQIDIVLHNADELFVSELEEGELSILQSEITKMTIRIKEQNEMLKKEKKQRFEPFMVPAAIPHTFIRHSICCHQAHTVFSIVRSRFPYSAQLQTSLIDWHHFPIGHTEQLRMLLQNSEYLFFP